MKPIQFLMLLPLVAPVAQATGVVPSTSVVIVEAADGEGVIDVKNTDAEPRLLYTSIYDLKEDPAHLLVVTPPVARVESGKTQVVRFIMDSKEPLKTERLKRVIFEGIPPAEKGKNEVRLSVRQDLPVIIRPEGLKRNDQPWKLLSWSRAAGKLQVANDSPYVVRLGAAVTLLPSNKRITLDKTYVLPGEHLAVDAKGAAAALQNASQLRISPATVYGYTVPFYDAPISAAQPTTMASAPAAAIPAVNP
jgi:P pilus assembly chaperone PapD